MGRGKKRLGRSTALAGGPLSSATAKTRTVTPDARPLAEALGVIERSLVEQFDHYQFHAVARVSPDGEWVAYIDRPEDRAPYESQRLFVVPSGGGPALELAELPGQTFDLDWLPDSSGLVCEAGSRGGLAGERCDLFRLPLDGSEAELLTSASCFPCASSCSPDGRWLAYEAMQDDGKLAQLDGNASWAIFTKSLVDGETSALRMDADGPLAWRPDGSSLVWVEHEEDYNDGTLEDWRDDCDGSTVTLVIGDPEGHLLARVLELPDHYTRRWRSIDEMSWSADGRYLCVVASEEVESERERKSRVLLYDFGLHAPHSSSPGGLMCGQATQIGDCATGASWHPGGGALAYVALAPEAPAGDSAGELHLYDIESGEERSLGATAIRAPAWLPDGRGLIAGKSPLPSQEDGGGLALLELFFPTPLVAGLRSRKSALAA